MTSQDTDWLPGAPAVLDAVTGVRTAVDAVALPLDTPGTGAGRDARRQLLAQLDDYVLPRLRALDAPLLAVVGGSTGAGKSTLVNSLLGRQVSAAGVLRPTTRASVLVHHPDDADSFSGDRVLPGLARLTTAADDDGTSAAGEDPGTVRLVASDRLPSGLALLDAPDIDSVVRANRDLARQLLAAADLWVFLTTAARYADAVPWDLLREAADRGTSIALVLDRVPEEALGEVRADLDRMLTDQGLGEAPLFVIPEVPLGADGLLPGHRVARVDSWLRTLATDSRARTRVIRATLDGALGSLTARTEALGDAIAEQQDAARGLEESAALAYDEALTGINTGVQDGSLLRGEVLARWQELVGTGEFLRSIEAGIGRLRDRISGFFRAKAVPVEPLGEALHSGVAQLVLSELQAAALRTARTWRTTPAGAGLLADHPTAASAPADLGTRVETLVHDWQGAVLDLVREQAGSKRRTARYLAFGVNGLAVVLMLVVFSATAGLTGAEVGIAGGSALLAQRLLEAVFGDQAVRELASKARADLLERIRAVADTERARYEALVADAGTAGLEETGQALRSAMRDVEAAR